MKCVNRLPVNRYSLNCHPGLYSIMDQILPLLAAVATPSFVSRVQGFRTGQTADRKADLESVPLHFYSLKAKERK